MPRCSCRCDDKFAWNPKAFAEPPLLDRIHIGGADSRPNLITESRPGECDGAAHKRCVAGIPTVGERERDRNAAVFDSFELGVSAQTHECVLLSELEE